jgi:hypothetical protein
MRAVVLLAQGVFWNAYFLCYIVSPKTCHSFVGYLEEEAVRTYTHAIRDLRAGHLPQWQDLSAPEVGGGGEDGLRGGGAPAAGGKRGTDTFDWPRESNTTGSLGNPTAGSSKPNRPRPAAAATPDTPHHDQPR